MENIKRLMDLIGQKTNDNEREKILKGLEEMFRFGDIKDMYPELHYALLRIRKIYPE